jgi:signal transduction histidine kinase
MNLGDTQYEKFRHLLDTVVALRSESDLQSLLTRVVETALEMVDASYGALGVLNQRGDGLSAFVTAGMSPEEVQGIGKAPEGLGVLGVLIDDPRPLRLEDLHTHPKSHGMPANHPDMSSFLGVPVLSRGEAFGNLYLTNKIGGSAFTESDEQVLLGLAAAASVAIDNFRMLERLREFDLVTERERIARDLHDTVIQRLFATGLRLQATVRLIEEPLVAARIEAAVDDLDVTVREIRSAIFELHEPVGAGGLRTAVLALCREIGEATGLKAVVSFEGVVESASSPEILEDVLAVIREGLANVARHSRAKSATVTVAVDDHELVVSVIDNGIGPLSRGRIGNGLRNLRERAARYGGHSSLLPTEDGGSSLWWVIPIRPVASAR